MSAEDSILDTWQVICQYRWGLAGGIDVDIVTTEQKNAGNKIIFYLLYYFSSSDSLNLKNLLTVYSRLLTGQNSSGGRGVNRILKR